MGAKSVVPASGPQPLPTRADTFSGSDLSRRRLPGTWYTETAVQTAVDAAAEIRQQLQS